MTPLVLCGGSETRLWPLRRKLFPKQFVPLIDTKSLLQLTLESAALISHKVTSVASEAHRFLVFGAIQAANVAMLPFTRALSDICGWRDLAKLTQADAQRNCIHDEGFAQHSSNTLVYALNRTVVILSTQDLLVIDTPDCFLVAAGSHVERVKQGVACLGPDNFSQSAQHRKVSRPWGAFFSVNVGERHQVNRITLRPGAKLSLQIHHHRAEHWIVLNGTALVTKGEEEILLIENQSIFIPLRVKHRLENPGKTDLELIEVQSGINLGEDDIVRIDDIYGRG